MRLCEEGPLKTSCPLDRRVVSLSGVAWHSYPSDLISHSSHTFQSPSSQAIHHHPSPAISSLLTPGHLLTYSHSPAHSLAHSLTSLSLTRDCSNPPHQTHPPPNFASSCRPCKYTHAYISSLSAAQQGLVTLSSPPPHPSFFTTISRPMSRISVHS